MEEEKEAKDVKIDDEKKGKDKSEMTDEYITSLKFLFDVKQDYKRIVNFLIMLCGGFGLVFLLTAVIFMVDSRKQRELFVNQVSELQSEIFEFISGTEFTATTTFTQDVLNDNNSSVMQFNNEATR